MGVGRSPGLEGFGYKGGSTMWSWMLHRVSGLGMIVFIGMHVVSAFLLQQYGSGVGKVFNTLYESWPFQAFIYFCIIFHAINGARIIILDTWPQLLVFQREATWLQWLIFTPIYGLTLLIMVQRGLAGG
jgi:succinate dehydrogenase / fumarate reductase, cytochrome b subunit